MTFINTTFSQLKYTNVFSPISQVTTFPAYYWTVLRVNTSSHHLCLWSAVIARKLLHVFFIFSWCPDYEAYLSPHVTETCGSNVAYSEHHMQNFIFSFPYESCCLFFARRNKVTRFFLSRALIHNVWLQGNSRWCSSVIGHSRVSRFSTLHQGGRSRQSLWAGIGHCDLGHYLHHNHPLDAAILIGVGWQEFAPHCASNDG